MINPTVKSTFYRRPPAPLRDFTVVSAAILSKAAPVSSPALSPCISISLVRSNLGFLSTLTLRMKTSLRGKMDWHFFSISVPMDSGKEML